MFLIVVQNDDIQSTKRKKENMKNTLLVLFIIIGVSLSAQKEEKFKATKDMKSIDALRGEIEVKLGTKIYYSGSVHGSVGETFSISADKELKFLKRYHEFDHPEKADMSGGDAATVTYVYETTEVGEFTVQIVKEFRGKVLNTHNVKVKVVE